ncbi:hypothetical protein VSS74_24225 [Conexibacter stalactiti]|uniref:WD40 repeat domain-containing protein n=1 Tax=Conexibacter stalactiti TaxID=1940611 RepID=A0ABU4HW75_9ACTN|nr:hypothetical protein [Conexibacter stalactiti]MDW5597478.1 hypothetical protein [Conexibacter stalactiti]MEC5038120.1 hypothetical protein [Conexibacter stalactiti]
MRSFGPLLIAAALGIALGSASSANAETRAESCTALSTAGTVNALDTVPFTQLPPQGSLEQWPAAPAGLLPARVHLRSERESFNARYAFATRGGQIYVAPVAGGAPGWRRLPLPACFAGRVVAISADDDELVAIDRERRVFTLDNALKGPDLFNWSRRWGPPLWSGKGRTLPRDVAAWSWSVISPAEDVTFHDTAGNAHAIGAHKDSHIWALRTGGQRLTLIDPWLPNDDSYETCGPHRGRFRAVNVSASGSTVFVIGADGDLFTRLYDFDIAGHNPIFFRYSYERQRTGDPAAPIQLPSPPWVRQPKVPGEITSAISISKRGVGAIHRTLRVEGRDRRGRAGYWEKDVVATRSSAWRFHRTGDRLRGRLLDNSPRDSSRRDLGAAADLRFAGAAGALRIEVADFNLRCSPARLLLRAGRGEPVELRLHNVDALRQLERATGLDDQPREQYGTIEVPPALLARLDEQPAAVRELIATKLGGRRFTSVGLRVTEHALRVTELDWTLRR